eukprot:6178664-Pleurochrysis_carterae.AAC.1
MILESTVAKCDDLPGSPPTASLKVSHIETVATPPALRLCYRHRLQRSRFLILERPNTAHRRCRRGSNRHLSRRATPAPCVALRLCTGATH